MEVDMNSRESPVSLKTWMAELPPAIAAQPLRLLKIPGSHDSGATTELDPKLPVSQDLPNYIRKLAVARCIKDGIKRWGVCQNYSIRGQLDRGIRYLDLRVAYPPAKVRSSEKDFRVVHGLYGMTLRRCLTQVSEFLKENEKEVVLFDMNQMYDIDAAAFEIVRREVIAVLGKSWLCPFTLDTDVITLNYMWTYGYRVIVFSPFEAVPTEDTAPILFWPSQRIPSPWPNTSNIDTLLAALQRGLDSRPMSSRKLLRFFVTQGVLTPQQKDVARHWFSSLERFTDITSSRVLQWIDELPAETKQKINVVILDFIEDHTSNFIVSLNKSSLSLSETDPLETAREA